MENNKFMFIVSTIPVTLNGADNLFMINIDQYDEDGQTNPHPECVKLNEEKDFWYNIKIN